MPSLNPEVRKALLVAASRWYPDAKGDWDDQSLVMEVLREGERVHRSASSDGRWESTFSCVAKIDGETGAPVFVEYAWGISHGDEPYEGALDLAIESARLVKPVEVLRTEYVPC